MIVEMENHKFEVKRVTHLKSHRHIYTLLLCYRVPTDNLVKNMGNMGIFFVKNMGGLWDFSTKIWEEYGKN